MEEDWMREHYVEDFKEMIQNERLQYETFKQHINVVPDAFQNSVSNHLSLAQLTDVANNLEGENYEGRVFQEDELELTADTYDELGIIRSDVKIRTGDKIYKAPDYHGRGGSTSWNEIVTELNEAVEKAERQYAWIQRRDEEERGLEEFQ
jgi:hypothetical protein